MKEMSSGNSRAIRLSQLIAQAEEDILTEAFFADNPDALRELTARTVRLSGRSGRFPPFIGRIAAACACLVITLGVLFGIELLPSEAPAPPIDGIVDGVGNGGSGEPPGGENGGNNNGGGNGEGDTAVRVEINNIDKLNYYSARRLLAEAGVLPADAQGTGGVYTALSADAVAYADVISDVYYYGLDPNERFTVKSVIFFQIELSGENGFLASKVGVGTVDVVVTETDHIELSRIITFKNGERFYSCLLNGADGLNTPKKTYIFSTHKYIDGFFVVKNLEQYNFSFSVTVTETEVTDFSCSYWNTPPQSLKPDNARLINGTGVIARVSGSFTAAELEGYLNGKRKENYA